MHIAQGDPVFHTVLMEDPFAMVSSPVAKFDSCQILFMAAIAYVQCARQVRYARAVCLRAEPVPRAATGVSPVSSLALVGARQLPIPLIGQDPTLRTPPGLPIAVPKDPKLLSHPSPVS